MPAWWTFLFSVRLSASISQGDGCLCVDFARAFLVGFSSICLVASTPSRLAGPTSHVEDLAFPPLFRWGLFTRFPFPFFWGLCCRALYSRPWHGPLFLACFFDLSNFRRAFVESTVCVRHGRRTQVSLKFALYIYIYIIHCTRLEASLLGSFCY